MFEGIWDFDFHDKEEIWNVDQPILWNVDQPILWNVDQSILWNVDQPILTHDWDFGQPILTNHIELVGLDLRFVSSNGRLKQKDTVNETLSLGHLPKWARKKNLQESQMIVMETNGKIWKTPETLEPVMNISMDPVRLTSSQRERRYKTLLIFGQKKIKWTQFGVDYKSKYPVRSEFARIRKRQGGRFVKK
jgi:hypothetical protein